MKNLLQLLHLQKGKEAKMDVIPNSSPLPEPEQSVVKCDFFEALRLLSAGKRITKLEWADNNTYGILADAKVMLYRDGNLHDWIISDGDLSGIDWVAID